MRVAIAGASGFLGSAIARAVGDVIPLPRTVPRSLGPVDVLVWAAGTREVDTVEGHAAHGADAIVAIAALLPSRVIYLSTGEIYGDVPLPFREDSAPRGVTAYARAKLAGEAAIHEATRAFGGTAIALRLGVVYGPGQRPTMLIPQLLRALRANQPIALTSGEQTRDFVHVDDVVKAVATAITTPSPPHAINVGSGSETRVRYVCLELARLFGRDRALLQFGARSPRTSEPAHYALDISLAARVLGWHPQIPLADGLRGLVHR